jgi:glycosyltransferase involved in cell wall biosynthesis
MSPLVSIILPVFNCSSYLKESIDSILQQTYSNLEVIIINDGSTDNSDEIIKQYADKRIKYYQNQKNEGLVFTLNKGIDLAKGAYIARMDADDICLPERIALQVDFMQNHLEYTMVAGLITFINEQRELKGSWILDQKNTQQQNIKKTLLKENCIAHPTVFFRTSKIKNFRYNPANQHCEDYGLWLDLVANNHLICKIEQVVLLYRVHTQSITGNINKKRNPFFINAKVKARLLVSNLRNKRWGLWQTFLMMYLIRDMLLGTGKEVKRKLRLQ